MLGLRVGTSSAVKGSARRFCCVSALEPGRDGARRSASHYASAAAPHLSRLLSLLPGMSSGLSTAQQPAATSSAAPVPSPGAPTRSGVLLPHAAASPSAPVARTGGGNNAPGGGVADAPRPSGASAAPASSIRAAPHGLRATGATPVLSAPPLPGRDATGAAHAAASGVILAAGMAPPHLPLSDLIMADERRNSSAASSSSSGNNRGATRLHHRHHHPHHRHVHLPHDDAAAVHPTLRLIASRIRAGCAPGRRSDGRRLGLVVEGGGMRGCISGAMLMALHDLGLTSVFDAVYGASAGAINATYFLAGQREGLSVYYEDLTRGSAFLDFRNLLSGSSRPVMNLDYLVDEVMTTSKPLDWDAVLASPAPLKVVASCIDTCTPVLLDNFVDRAELAEALKATAAVPKFAGPPRQLRGRTLVDAAVFEGVPVPSAVRDGCDHVLVLCTRPPPTLASPMVKRMRSTMESLAKTTILNAPYMREAWRIAAAPAIAHADEALLSALRSCPHEVAASMGAYVLPLYPQHTAGCHPLCLDPPTLMAACEVGREALLQLLGPVVAAAAADMEAAPDAEWGLAAAREFGGAELYSAGMDLRYRP